MKLSKAQREMLDQAAKAGDGHGYYFSPMLRTRITDAGRAALKDTTHAE